MPCPVALTPVSGGAATSITWKGEEGGDEKAEEPSEDQPAETRQSSAKEAGPLRFGKGRSARHLFYSMLIRCSFSANKCYFSSLF